MTFKEYFETTTGQSLKGTPGTLISDHINLIAETIAKYVDLEVQKLRNLNDRT